MELNQADKILWRHIRDLPYFRALVRAVEDSFYQDIELPGPVLDVGCGDGHFASVAFSEPIDVGIDPWWDPLQEAKSRNCYRLAVRADGGYIPFEDGWFASAISNSVLEHIPHVEKVMLEVSRVVRPGGRLILCMPNHRFPMSLLGRQIFIQVGLHGLADWYTNLFNRRVSRHIHTDPLNVWEDRLGCAGFLIEESWDYLPPQALHVVELGHLFGLPALVSRKLTGNWILVKNWANLAIPYRLTRRFTDHPISGEGVYTFIIARREGGKPL